MRMQRIGSSGTNGQIKPEKDLIVKSFQIFRPILQCSQALKFSSQVQKLLFCTTEKNELIVKKTEESYLNGIRFI